MNDLSTFYRTKSTSDDITVSGRLAQVREDKLGTRTRAKLAQMLGLDPTVYGRYEMGREPPLTVVVALLRLFPDVRASWLLTGEGEPYIDNVGAAPSPGGGHAPPEQDLRRAATRAEQTILQQASAIETLKALLDRKDVPRMDVRPKFRLVGSKRELAQAEGAHWTEQYVAVPLLSDEAAAGNPRHVRDDQIGGYALVYSRWVRDVETTRCLRVKGDSMEPVLPDGSICAVDLAQRDPKALLKKIVAARVDDGVTIKWLQLAKEVLVLRPENREHDTIVLHPGEDEDNPIVGQVTWWWAPAP